MSLGVDVAITHKFVSGKADGADGTLVQPSKWNQNQNLGAGSDGQIIVRDSSQADGGSWVDAGSAYQVRGLLGVNNAGTPNTQFDLSANLVVLRHATLGYGRGQVNTGTITNNVSTAGPAANGRDQAGAFSASSWIHFYFIWGDGQSLATLSSAVAPPTGPTLPTNYTHWAYATSIRFDGSSHLLSTLVRGTMAFYAPLLTLLGLGTATVETGLSLTAFVPPTALRVQIAYDLSSSAAVNAVGRLRFITAQDFQIMVTGPTSGDRDTGSVLMPVLSQNIFYKVDGANMALNLYVQGYVVPNGGE